MNINQVLPHRRIEVVEQDTCPVHYWSVTILLLFVPLSKLAQFSQVLTIDQFQSDISKLLLKLLNRGLVYVWNRINGSRNNGHQLDVDLLLLFVLIYSCSTNPVYLSGELYSTVSFEKLGMNPIKRINLLLWIVMINLKYIVRVRLWVGSRRLKCCMS